MQSLAEIVLGSTNATGQVQVSNPKEAELLREIAVQLSRIAVALTELRGDVQTLTEHLADAMACGDDLSSPVESTQEERFGGRT